MGTEAARREERSPLAELSVLVTGGTGFIGQHLVDRLLAARCRIGVLARDPARVPPQWSQQGVSVHRGDISDASAVADAIRLAAPRVVFHLASTRFNPPTADLREHVAVICGGTANVLAAVGASDARVVHVGSAAEYGSGLGMREDHALQPSTHLGAAKAAASLLVQAAARSQGTSAVVLRLFTPYGPGDHPGRLIPTAVQAALRGENVRVSDGRQQRDFVYVDDVVEALARAGTVPLPAGTALNICSGKATSVREAVETILELLGSRARIEMRALTTRPDEIWELSGDNGAAGRQLGWEPTITLRDGLSRTIAWSRSHPAVVPV